MSESNPWIIGSVHPVYGVVQMMGRTGGEAYRWMLKDGVVSMIPLTFLDQLAEGMIGQRVEFPVDHITSGAGVVIAHDLETGQITVRDEDDASLWQGYEYQLA